MTRGRRLLLILFLTCVFKVFIARTFTIFMIIVFIVEGVSSVVVVVLRTTLKFPLRRVASIVWCSGNRWCLFILLESPQFHAYILCLSLNLLIKNLLLPFQTHDCTLRLFKFAFNHDDKFFGVILKHFQSLSTALVFLVNAFDEKIDALGLFGYDVLKLKANVI